MATVVLAGTLDTKGTEYGRGGPTASPADAAHVIGAIPGVAGVFEASSMERLPTEIAITDTLREFKSIPLGS